MSPTAANSPVQPATEAPFAPRLEFVPEERIRPLLQRVEKPGRYTGGEFGIPKRDPRQAEVRVALSYPDTYELGMSNEGLKILYDWVNKNGPRFYADRVYLPWPDMEREMRARGAPLYSLDYFLNVRSFDVWGFNTAHELHFTNLCYALDLAGIPLEREARGPEDPIILTGGTAVSNPLPLFPIMDGVFMGDGEEALLEICEIVAAGKGAGKTRTAILDDLSSVEGLLLPRNYRVIEPEAPGEWPRYELREGKQPVTKRNYRGKGLGQIEHLLVPNIEITQDRVVVEVARGCGQGCRFCHAGFWKRPVRSAEVQTLVESAGAMLKKTGANEVALHSLSIADYPWLEELVIGMAQNYAEQGVSLSLPSLRVQVKTIPVLEMTSGIRRSNVTFALEAASELQRERIRKKSSEENLHYLIREIYARGWDLVKVYFMMGLPDRDGREIDDLIRALNDLGKLAEECGPRKKVNVTVSLFVPKPFTTFQWEAQATPEYFTEGLKRVKREVQTRRVTVKGPEPHMAYVEGLLSRADHRAFEVYREAYRRGAKFDSWDDQFSRDLWLELIEELDPALVHLWMGQKTGGDWLPWTDLISAKGVSPELLVKDFQRFESITEENMNPPHPQALQESDFPPELLKPIGLPPHKFESRCVLALDFAKGDPFIYVSHLETAEVVRKAARRAGLPMAFSQGFNKHEKFHFLESLPLFFHSERETIYVELYQSVEELDLAAIEAELRAEMPEGLALLGVQATDKLPKQREINEKTRRWRFDFFDAADAEAAFAKLQAAPETISYEKRERKKKKLKKLRRHESNRKIVERRLGSALRALRLDPGAATGAVLRSGAPAVGESQASIIFEIEPPALGGISIADLLTFYLELPAETWNTRVRIVKED